MMFHTIDQKLHEEEPEDDGFLQAFNDAADEDWPDFTEEAENADDEEETTDI